MKKLFAVLPLLLLTGMLFGQSGLQLYTPSVLLSKGQSEYKLFNSLYTQTEGRDKDGNDFNLGERQSFFNNQFRFLYGVSSEKRLNIGLEVNLTTAKYKGETDNSNDYSNTLVSSIGPTLKFIPIPKIGHFSIQSTFLIPIGGDDLESPKFINHNRNTWFTQFFYDHTISEKWNIFFEVDFLLRLQKTDLQNTFFRTPFSTILSYFPTSKLTLYGQIQHAPKYGTLAGAEDVDFGRISWFTQLGIGAKYQVMPSFEVEVSYGDFLWSKRDGAGQVFSLGLRFLK